MREMQAGGRRTASGDAIFPTIELQRTLVDRARSSTKARRQRADTKKGNPQSSPIIAPDVTSIN
jgi:hypothetical protein